MPVLDEILDANRRADHAQPDPGGFVAARHLCIVTCVDPRLTHFFGRELGVERGHAVALRVPGAHIPKGSELLRALAATIYVNDCQEVLVMPHTDCGVARVSEGELTRVMRARGVLDDAIPADAAAFFGLVKDAREAALETVEAIRTAPFLPRLPVHCAMMDIRTGVLTLVERGYDAVYR
ncbi:beta-class carbonic anhydrase [Anaeromyxobacter terrae]|uniref:beta-class carbonic anhydrase n=1 Tax=Anaeromyxobacter terrae TaxID=2925406 RepID=UPI001F59F5B9|nr:carbonic anhydrase [Anaeromyxobacter sp. SG22]